MDASDPVEMVTDRCIRRALGFAGFGVGLTMLALSFDLALALRSGANLAAMLAVAMLLVAWHAPRRDMRHSEPWMTLQDMAPELTRGRSKKEMQERLREAMRRRLLWHAERVGLLAVALWAFALLAMALRGGAP